MPRQREKRRNATQDRLRNKTKQRGGRGGGKINEKKWKKEKERSRRALFSGVQLIWIINAARSFGGCAFSRARRSTARAVKKKKSVTRGLIVPFKFHTTRPRRVFAIEIILLHGKRYTGGTERRPRCHWPRSKLIRIFLSSAILSQRYHGKWFTRGMNKNREINVVT